MGSEIPVLNRSLHRDELEGGRFLNYMIDVRRWSLEPKNGSIQPARAQDLPIQNRQHTGSVATDSHLSFLTSMSNVFR